MPRARKHLVCIAQTPYYLITSRCVRRAFLCGVDRDSGNSYEHRRSWVEDRIRVLSSLFSVTVCAYAVMSNHYHIVVRLEPESSKHWSDDEVLSRWTALFRGPLLVQRHRAGEALTVPELDAVRSAAAVYRNRLASLSWFMKCLNEPIARRANAEDDCTGHFWESRFHSLALFTEQALLTAMAYVDLNPVRAGLAETPEQSDYTSIRARCQGDYQYETFAGAVARLLSAAELNHCEVPVRPLVTFAVRGQSACQQDAPLPICEHDYLQLVDITGRFVMKEKRGRIDPAAAPILERLGLSFEEWFNASTGFRQQHRGRKAGPQQSA